MGNDITNSRHLLFGVFAWRLGYIDKAQLTEALRKCVDGEADSIGQAMIELGFITSDTCDQLAAMMVDQVAHHGGDQQESLASLGCDESTLDSLLEDTSRAAQDRSSTGNDSFSTNEVLPIQSELRRIKLHAQGGLGRVFRAYDEQLDRQVALKEVRPDFADDEEARARFLREAQITGSCSTRPLSPCTASGETNRDARTMRCEWSKARRSARRSRHFIKLERTAPPILVRSNSER